MLTALAAAAALAVAGNALRAASLFYVEAGLSPMRPPGGTTASALPRLRCRRPPPCGCWCA
jgi:hypothetical protein